MTSINTNTSAMTALQSLSMINSNLDQTQNRISTGHRVGAASDNAAYWSIATTMRSDNKALGAVEDALGLGGFQREAQHAHEKRIRTSLPSSWRRHWKGGDEAEAFARRGVEA